MPGRFCQRTYPLCWGPLVLERGGGQVWSGRDAGCVRGRCKGEKPGGLPWEYLAHDAVQGSRPGAVVQRVGRGRVGVSIPSHIIWRGPLLGPAIGTRSLSEID